MVRFVVKGRPVSVQSSSGSRANWTTRVRTAAAAKCSVPLDGNDLRIRTTFFYNTLPDFDTDNISKPICDALNGVVYQDDHQLGDRLVRRRDINGSYRIKGIDPELAVAIAEGDDFVYIEVDRIEAGEVGSL
jgi:crossover junction endodeoxyribonuclease RusA